MIGAGSTEERFAARALEVAAAPPAATLRPAARHVADTVGVAIAGSVTPPVRAALTALGGSGGPARLLGSATPAAPDAATLINGMAAHIHDFDDDDPLVIVGHPSAPVVVALLAAAGGRRVSGRAALGAYLAGVETVFRLGRLVNPGHYNAGWHATATLGVFGAAVAAGTLMGLSAPTLAHALRLAAAQTSGLKASFGSDAKALQVGRAAQAGYLSAAWAGAGLTGGAGALLGPSGFLALHRGTGGGFDADEAVRGFAEPPGLLTPGFNIKRHPCCSSSHTAIDAVLELRREHGLAADNVDGIEVAIGPDIPAILIHDRPRTGLEAKFSVRHPVAVALLRGRLRLEDFADAALHPPELRALADRVRVVIDAALPRHATGVTHASRVRLTLRTGRVLERQIAEPLGGATRPLSDAQLQDKFVECAAPVIGPAAAERGFAALMALADGATPDDALAAAEAPP